MDVLEDLSLPAQNERPSALSIGSFDGVHLGHQKILAKMRDLVGSKGSICIITFSNHPTHVLPGREPVELIFSKELKLKWLENYGVDVTYCVEFTKELAELEYDAFLDKMMKVCPFDHLVLGEGAKLGKKQGGSPEKVSQYGDKKGFATHYLHKLEGDKEIVSSRRVRTCLKEGNLDEAIRLLGHSIH